MQGQSIQFPAIFTHNHFRHACVNQFIQHPFRTFRSILCTYTIHTNTKVIAKKSISILHIFLQASHAQTALLVFLHTDLFHKRGEIKYAWLAVSKVLPPSIKDSPLADPESMVGISKDFIGSNQNSGSCRYGDMSTMMVRPLVLVQKSF